MPRLFLGNFDFETRLAGHRGSLPAALAQINDDLATVWLAIAEDGDFLWMPPCEPGFFETLSAAGLPRVTPLHNPADIPPGLELVPWGWTDEARDLARRWRCTNSAPDPSAVAAANSRRLSFRLESDWNVGLNGAAAIDSVATLERRLPDIAPDDRWVLKANFSNSARERILGRGPVLSEPQRRWIERRLSADGLLVFEPWVDRIAAAGLQFTISPPGNGPPVFEGAVPLLTDATGRYRGSRFSGTETANREWSDALPIATRAAGPLQQLGYFGPLGLDGMRYRDAGGTIRVRPLQDINARWTMGRLSLGLRRFLHPGEHASWLHFRWPTESIPGNCARFEAIAGTLPAGTRLLGTSPFEVAGRATRLAHALILAPSQDALTAAEAHLASMADTPHRPR